MGAMAACERCSPSSIRFGGVGLVRCFDQSAQARQLLHSELMILSSTPSNSSVEGAAASWKAGRPSRFVYS